MIDRLKDTVSKMPFGGTMAVVVGLVEGTAGEVLKAVPIPRRREKSPPSSSTRAAPTDAAVGGPDQPDVP
jgi:hypothetical protein